MDNLKSIQNNEGDFDLNSLRQVTTKENALSNAQIPYLFIEYGEGILVNVLLKLARALDNAIAIGKDFSFKIGKISLEVSHTPGYSDYTAIAHTLYNQFDMRFQKGYQPSIDIKSAFGEFRSDALYYYGIVFQFTRGAVKRLFNADFPEQKYTYISELLACEDLKLKIIMFDLVNKCYEDITALTDEINKQNEIQQKLLQSNGQQQEEEKDKSILSRGINLDDLRSTTASAENVSPEFRWDISSDELLSKHGEGILINAFHKLNIKFFDMYVDKTNLPNGIGWGSGWFKPLEKHVSLAHSEMQFYSNAHTIIKGEVSAIGDFEAELATNKGIEIGLYRDICNRAFGEEVPKDNISNLLVNKNPTIRNVVAKIIAELYTDIKAYHAGIMQTPFIFGEVDNSNEIINL